MGLLSTKKPIPKKNVKPPKKPNIRTVKEAESVDTTTIEEKGYKTVEPDIEEESYKEAETDVNDNSKIEFVGGENLENEKISETDKSKEVIVESLEVKDENDNATLTIDSKGEIEEVAKEETVEEVTDKEEPKEEVVEEKPKKKTRRKSTAKKVKETKEEITEEGVTEIKPCAVITDAKKAEEYLQDVLIYSTEEWEAEEDALRNRLKELTVRADLNPDEIRILLGKLSESYIEVKDRLISTERIADSLETKIKNIRTLASVGGTNAAERNVKGVLAVTCFKKDPKDKEGVDLEQYLLMLKHKINFYDYCARAMEYNRQLLITFSSVFKIEINNY